ncbi:hypothetical protein GCM10027447_12340 [Glycomyces halotolerans]
MSDDLAPFMVPDDSPGVRYGQGKIISWNAETFANVIEWNGQKLQDLDVLAGVDALSWAPGMFVSLKGVDASGSRGVTQWVIEGRIIRPGSGSAEEIISFMRGSLARQISAEILGDRFDADYMPENATRTLTTYGDPDGIDPGPVVADMEISEAGLAVVWLSAMGGAQISGSGDFQQGGWMSVEVSGATSRPADDDRASFIDVFGGSTSGGFGINSTPGRAVVIEGLNEGAHTFTAKYRAEDGTDGCFFYRRGMVVLGL